MANELENSLFFPGGRTLFAETNEIESPGLKFTKSGDDWLVTMHIKIPAAEAKNVIKTFEAFGDLSDNETFKGKFPKAGYSRLLMLQKTVSILPAKR